MEIGVAAVAVVAPGSVEAEAVLVEVVVVVAKEGAGGHEFLVEVGVFGSFVAVAFFFLMFFFFVSVFLVLRGFSVGGGEGEEGLVKFFHPSDFDSFSDEAFFAEELGGGEVCIDEVPGVEVAVVLEADAVEEAASADLEATGEVFKFGEAFFQFGLEVVVGAGGKGVDIYEGGEPVIDFEVQAGVEALECDAVIGVVCVTADVSEGFGRGLSDESAEVEGGVDFDLGEGDGSGEGQKCKCFHNAINLR